MAQSKAKRANIKDYEIVFTFRILYDGWEMDNEAWIARNKAGELVFLQTDHGSLWDCGKDISFLHGAVKETRDSLAGLKKAIRMMSK